MTAAGSLTLFLQGVLAPATWRHQFGRWLDGGTADRYVVVKPAGGLPAGLVRRPQFTVSLIGEENADQQEIAAAADAVVEAMRASSGQIVSLQPAEPVFMATSDGRPVFEIAVSAITN